MTLPDEPKILCSASNIIEWEEQRKGRPTSSSLSPIMMGKRVGDTKGCMTYIYEKAAEKLGISKKRFSTPATRWGNANELKAIWRFEYDKDLIVEDIGEEQLFWAIDGCFGGTPDGRIIPNDFHSLPGVIEVKCPDTKMFLQYYHLKTPKDVYRVSKDYYYQVYANMILTGAEVGYFLVYDPRIPNSEKHLHVIEFPKDKEVMEEIVERSQQATLLIETYAKTFEESDRDRLHRVLEDIALFPSQVEGAGSQNV